MKIAMRPMGPHLFPAETAASGHLEPITDLEQVPSAPSLLVRNPFTFAPPGLPPVNVITGNPRANG